MNTVDALRLDATDSVIVALRDIASGETVRWQGAGGAGEIVAAEPVPLGHKLSLADLPAGQRVLKYGAAIGETRAPIRTGAHVHVHNLASLRARSGA